MRLHPQSAWASSKPPSRLLFGLIDVGSSAWQSAAVGLYAFFSLLNRSLLYMMCTQVWGILNMLASEGKANMQDLMVLTAFVIVPVSSLVLNVVLLLGLRSWFVLPAAVISMFINIPWATGRTTQFRTSRWSSWPAWVMEFAYCGGTIFFMIVARFSLGVPVRGPEKRFIGRAPGRRLSGRYPVCSRFSGSYGDSFTLGFVVVAAVVCVADFVLFLVLAGWQSDRRRKYNKQHGSTEHMAADLDIAVDLPVSPYKVSGMYAVLCNPVESKDMELAQSL